MVLYVIKIKWEVVGMLNVAYLFYPSIVIVLHNTQAHLSHLGTFHINEEMEMASREWL
jgi:hypothetical protein